MVPSVQQLMGEWPVAELSARIVYCAELLCDEVGEIWRPPSCCEHCLERKRYAIQVPM